MQPERRRRTAQSAIAAAALIAGLAAMFLWRVLSAGEHLPYRSGATPQAAQVTQSRTYSLAVPGGVPAMLRAGVPSRSENGSEVLALQCSYTRSGGGARSPLDVTPESTSTKAQNTVARFVAPLTGRIHVTCSGWGAMFVPDSDDRPRDWAGLAVVLATVLLTGGAALGLSELRRARLVSVGTAGEDDQVE